MRTSLLLALAALVLVPSLAEASTTVVGGNVINQTWTPAGSPYIVQGDITVPAGAFLTLQPGTSVVFASSDGQAAGTDTTRVELIVNGTLNVGGTPASPVSFAAQSGTSAGLWYGIELNATATASINNATIDHTVTGITSAVAATAFSLSTVTVRTCTTYGTYVTAGSPTLDGLSVTGCNYGIYVGGGSPTFTHAVVYGNSFAGFYSSTTTASSTISYSTFASNGSYGVRNYRGAIALSSSIVTGATSSGCHSDLGTNFNVTYSDIWGNGINFNGASSGAGNISANPLYVGGTNYRITSNSPARFSSSTGIDMGGLAFTSDATVGMVGTLWTDTTIGAGVTPIPGDLTVAPGVTLTLSAGATLSFAASSDQMAAYTDTTRAELRILGTLTAVGTSGSPITLTSAGSSAGGWYGVELLAGATGSTIDYAIIEETVDGLEYASTTAQTVHHSTIRTCTTYGLYVTGGTPAIDALTITGCNYGVYGASGTLTLTNTLVYGNSFAGFYWSSTAMNSTITNCTFASNGSYGVRNYRGSIALSNSIVTGATSSGCHSDLGTNFSVTYSDVWGNGINFNGASSGAGNLSANPLYVGATDYHLQSSSICIDAGTATGAPSADRDAVARPLDGDGINGVGYDIGAYEYRLSAFCGDGVVTAGEACDDGVQNGTYGHCNASCSALGPRCGDSTVNGPEACDDGNTSNIDGCLNSCALPTCGDAYTHLGVEQCDDGNAVLTDACVMCMNASCGDGYTHVGVEQCDDGNATSTDGCVTCNNAFCGDGYTRLGVEACDDGNTSNTDACLSSCMLARCGDGYVGPGEQCDDGNTIDTDACSNTCRSAGCGDGIVQAGEQCDDGNMVNDDACSNACMSSRCGDGIIQSGEQCDDGNAVNTDACSNVCQSARCGDGIQQSSEQCDDGNTDPSDACTGTCTVASCGDGVVHGGVEACDDGNASNNDACVAGCVVASCGDTYLHTGVEACDDGNHVDGDGCSATCSLMSCGDGTVQVGEDCDDGNTSNLDACLNTCVNASCGDGFRRVGAEACDDGNADNTDACTSTCHVASCGDGFVHAGLEACDDGNGSDEDACLTSCVDASCGDHFVENGIETCDDGNTTPGDGCNASCMTEAAAVDGGTSADAGVDGGAGNDAGSGGMDAGSGSDAGGTMSDASTTSPDASGTPMPTNGGCGCSAMGREDRGQGWLLAVLGLTMLAARRRRTRPPRD